MSKPVVILGAGGHARVVVDILRLLRFEILGVVDNKLKKGEKLFADLTLLGGDDCMADYPSRAVDLVNGVGSLPGKPTRAELFRRFTEAGYQFPHLIHSSAIVASDVRLAAGAQVMAGAVIQPGTAVGENSIINTRASVDHDCRIGKNVHVAPGATLCGDVSLGDGVHVGSGATIIQGIVVSAGAIIGAGAVVCKNVETGQTVYPAKSITKTYK